MEEGESRLWEGYVDWKTRPAQLGRHGGMLPASFVLVVEVLENLAFLSNASNLVLYLSEYMHMSPTRSANVVTNFMATAFLFALLGGFLSDAFFTTYFIYLISSVIEFLGLIMLTVQARTPSLKPRTLSEEVDGGKAAMLFTGLYLVALGVGGIKGSLPVHGAEQFDANTLAGRKHRSTFFNYFVFCLSCGGLIAVTLVVWLEDNKGWQWGFGISTIAILLSIFIFLAGSGTYRNKIPRGSPFVTIFKVIFVATTNLRTIEATAQHHEISPSPATNSLGFLNRAVGRGATLQQVEDVKIVLKILPIFVCTIILNTCLAQLSTFSVQQAATMNTKFSSLTIPPASLPIFPIIFIMIIVPIYDHFIIPISRKLTKSEMGISHLQRIGVGLVLSIIAMAVAALVEVKRKGVAFSSPQHLSPLPITFFWIALQYLFLGSADLFTLAGLLEFFFTEAPITMRSLATSLSWASLAMGYYLSTVIVSIVNTFTSFSGHKPWLSGVTLNDFQLQRFYWLMCVLSGLNFAHYLLWACRYKYVSTTPHK